MKKRAKTEDEEKPVGLNWPVFDSMEACSGATGIPKALLKSLKDSGCHAFRSNRIYFGDLIPFLFGKEQKQAWADQTEEYQARTAKLEFEEKSGHLIPFEESLAIVRESLMPIRQQWLALASSLCSRTNPTDPQHAREALEAWTEQSMRLIADAEREKIRRIKK